MKVFCPYCGSNKIGVCRTTTHIYLPESFRSINRNCAVVEEREDYLKKLKDTGTDLCSFFCSDCLKNIEKKEFGVKKFIINGEEFF